MPTANPTSRIHAYWLCQWLGWGLVAAIFTLMFAAFSPGGTLIMAAIYTWASACGITLSHGWRSLLKRRGWLVSSVHTPWLAVVAIVVLLGLLETVLVTLAFMVLKPPGMMKGWDWLPGTIAGWVLIFAFWTTIYSYAVSRRRAKQFEAEALRLQVLAKDAELRALQAQVNPHFFFNSLNSLRGLIFENPNAAAQMIDQLAGIMRYALQAGDAAVLLTKEMEAVNAYLAIEKIRFEDRLRIEINIENGLHEMLLPPMALQTLVENAVKFGVERNRLGSTIRITARLHDGMVQIEVANEGSIAPFADSTKLGIANTRKRLQLLLNPAATLEIREEQGWVRVLMQWPFASGDNQHQGKR